MREKLIAHFMNFRPRRFVTVTVLILIVSDLLNSWYLRLWWVSKNMSQTLLLRTADQGGMSLEELGPDSIRELIQFFDNSFYFFLFIIIANNFFFYFFYLRRKLWAQGFVLFYTLTAAAFSALFIFDNAGLGSIWYLYNVTMIFVYLYLFFGVKYLKEKTVNLPNRGHETKAQ